MNQLAKPDQTAAAIITVESLKTSMKNCGLVWTNGELRLEGAVPSSLESVRTSLTQLTKPLSDEELGPLLNELWISTKKQNAMVDVQFRQVLDVYLNDLQGYPGDLVRNAVIGWKHTPKPRNAHHWFPASPELIDMIRAESEEILKLNRALCGFDLDGARSRRIAEIKHKLRMLFDGEPPVRARSMSPQDRADAIAEDIEKLEAELSGMET